MRSLKPVLVVILALVPILYCARLIYYFIDLSGSVEEAESVGLGPTLLGLTVVGLLFCIVLIVKIVRMFARPSSPGSGGRGGPDPSTPEGEGGFDAGAVISRYVAQRSTEAA